MRSWLPGSRWIGKTYHYRQDVDGFVWLNLDWIDSHRVQRPGAPYKEFDEQTIYRPSALVWEAEGDETDSSGAARLRFSPTNSLHIGSR